MKKFVPTAVKKQQNEVEVVNPIVKREVIVKGAEPNILVSQDRALFEITPNNLSPIFTTFDNCPTPSHAYYHREALLDYITQKFIFLLTDVYIAALNKCLEDTIINPKVVDARYFKPDFVVGRHEIEADIAFCTTRYCQDLFNKLYTYAVFGCVFEKPEMIVEYLNRSISDFSNLITFHISNYYNEMITVVGIYGKNYSQIELVGKYDEAYKNENIVGENFGNKELIEMNNKFLERARMEYDSIVAEYEFEDKE